MIKALRWIPRAKEPYTLYLMARDPRVPRHIKWRALSIVVLILAYTLSPLDISPDYLPVLGWLDDLILFPLGLFFLEKLLPRELLLENRAIAGKKVNRALLKVIIAVLIFLSFWALIIAAFVILMIRLVNG